MIRGRGAVLAAACTGFTFLFGGAGLAAPPAPPDPPDPPAKPAVATAPPGPKDKAVLRIDSDALGKDYLETNFIKAEKKLQQALATCAKKDACSDRVHAQLHRDLAVVYLTGLGRVDAAKESLKKAVALDPGLDLDPDYTTPELQKAFSSIRKGKARRTKAEPELKPGINHTPVTEQVVATPVPIFARLGGADSAKLRLWYRAVGTDRWGSVVMEFSASGYTGEIPCVADAKEGELAYFIEALNESQETIDKSGSRAEPHIVVIRKEIGGDAPHLPDAEPPSLCKNACEGEDCGGGGGGPAKPSGQRNNWFSVSIQQDLAIIVATVNACAGGNQVDGSYSCFRAPGSQYHGNPTAGDPADAVNAGLGLATTRILLGYDRVLFAGLTLGVRLGYVLRGLGPRADGGKRPLPFHAEGRLAYWFGSEAFTTATFRPYLFAAGGAAQVDTRFGVVVTEDTTVAASPNQPLCPTGAAPVICNPPQQRLDAYRRMGQGFIGGGGGFMVAFAPAIGMFLDVKYMHLLPTSGDAISPELGLAIGF